MPAVTWSDAHFDDVGPSEDQLLHHFSCHDVSSLKRKIKLKKSFDSTSVSIQHIVAQRPF